MTGDPLARYNAITLAVAQSFGGAVAPMAIALGGLVGITLLPAEQIWLATLPVSIFIFGAALSAIPAALMMRRFGRRARRRC